MLLRIPHRFKVTIWESSIEPLPHHPTKNIRCAPTLWLSIFHFCTLCLSLPVCSILLLLSGKLLKSPVDTASSTTSASWRWGFTALFWPGEDNTYHHGRRGDIPRAQMHVPKRQACLPFAWSEKRCVYLPSDFPRGSDKFEHFISSYTNSTSDIPTVLKKRVAYNLMLKETGVHFKAGSTVI